MSGASLTEPTSVVALGGPLVASGLSAGSLTPLGYFAVLRYSAVLVASFQLHLHMHSPLATFFLHICDVTLPSYPFASQCIPSML